MELLLLLIVGAVGTTLFCYVQRDDDRTAVPRPVPEPAPVDRQARVTGEALDYLEFFDLPRDLTATEAERVIGADWNVRTAEEKREWHAFYAILEDFSDPGLLAAFHLREVRRPTLMLALERLRNRGKTYQYIDEHAEDLVEAILALDPGAEVHRPERRSGNP